MRVPGFSKLELRIMEVLWARDSAAIREVQEALPGPRPAYTTVQTTMYRLEAKGAVRRVRKIGNAHIFAAAVTRTAAHRRLLDQVLALFEGRIQPMMAHWVETARLEPEDVDEAEQLLRRLNAERKRKGGRR